MLSRRLLLKLVTLTLRLIALLVVGLAIGLWLNKLFGNVLIVLVLVIPICLLLSLFVYFFGMSLRELEQARLIMDVLENGLAQGQSPETAVVTICQSAQRRKQSLGRKVHKLGAQIEAGRPLSEALKGVPGLLPPQVVAVLEVGVKVGDVGK